MSWLVAIGYSGLGVPAVMVMWPTLRPAEMPALPYQCIAAPGVYSGGDTIVGAFNWALKAPTQHPKP